MATTIPNVYGAYGSVYTVGSGGGSSTGISSWPPVTTAAPSYYTAGTGSSVFTTTANTYSNDIIIKREGKGDIRVGDTLEMLMDRLCIIQPAMDLIEKYPALREAYEQYKIIEEMVKNGDSDEI